MERPFPTILPLLFEKTLTEHVNRPAMAMFGEASIPYSGLALKIGQVKTLPERKKVKRGDKLAFLSSNIPNRSISNYAIKFMDSVVVPLLPDFHHGKIEPGLTAAIITPHGWLKTSNPGMVCKDDFTCI